MTTTYSYLPAAVRSGMRRKINEAIRNAVDGHPATRGTPMESEARYYHSFYMSGSGISFEDFVAALCRDLSAIHPEVGTSLDWIRECDRWSAIEAARRELARLRATAAQDRTFRISFWGMLWKVTEVYLEKFGLSCTEIGTTLEELSGLARGYLLRECGGKVQRLRSLMSDSVTTDTRAAFIAVDDMLHGIPRPLCSFQADRQNHVAAIGAYGLYRRTLENRPIDPTSVGWSHIEHCRCEALIFPQGRPRRTEVVLPVPDPTAPAVESCAEAAPERPDTPLSTATTFQPSAIPVANWIDTAEEALLHLVGLSGSAPQPA